MGGGASLAGVAEAAVARCVLVAAVEVEAELAVVVVVLQISAGE